MGPQDDPEGDQETEGAPLKKGSTGELLTASENRSQEDLDPGLGGSSLPSRGFGMPGPGAAGFGNPGTSSTGGEGPP